MSISIRSAEIDDAAEIAEVRVVTWRKIYRGLIPDDVLATLDIEEEAQRFRERIGKMEPERALFVAVTDEPGQRVVGYCFCGPDREPVTQGYGEVYALYVLPGYQGKGIGRSLVQTAGRWLAGKGFRRMIIFVLRENALSRKFYEAIGGQVEREKIDEVRGYSENEVGYGYHIPL